ncbi:MAG: sulfatase-like hydrolase/transferase [Planctomycetota bacterium]
MRPLHIILSITLLALTLSARTDTPPNIVFILADDQGWNALSIPMDPGEPGSGSTYYQTPRLARLATEGMHFSHAYSPAPTCSPTRHSIQFGRSPASLKIFGADGIKNWDAPNHHALPHLLKQLNPMYVTAHLGKWHIGRAPEDLGYDVHDGPKGNAHGNSKDPFDPKLIFDLSKRANAFMAEQVKAGRPFFIQISHYANHLRYQALPKTLNHYKDERADKASPYQNDPLWAAMNENLDTGVGMVLDQIDKLGIRDNTYVIYTADNGYELKKDFPFAVHERGFYKAYPQRSHKYHVSEGGIRVPLIVRGPGIPANTHSAQPVVGTDILPTVLHMAQPATSKPNTSPEIPPTVEGANLLPHLQTGGRAPIQRLDPFLVFRYSKPRVPHDIAIRQGDYKLIKDIDTQRVFLFNLTTDLGESHNLATAEPDRAQRMFDDLTAYLKRFGWHEGMIDNNPAAGRRPAGR